MLDNVYILYKIIIFIFFKVCFNKNYYLFYEIYFKNLNIISCISQHKESCYQDNKKSYIYHKGSKLNKNLYRNSTYRVKPGDTLLYIAWITGENYVDLAKNNNIENINLLKVNQVLKVKRNIIRSLFYKNLSRKILLLWYKNHYKISKLFFLKNQDNLSRKIKKNVFCTGKMINNSTLCTKKTNVKTLSTWNWPTTGLVVNTFSDSEGGNKGIDISGIFDQPVLATTDGRVVYVGNVLRGYGNLVVIEHNNSYLSAYAHNNKILVTERQKVKVGDQIATMGNSGTNEVKLHFEIRYKGKSINPLCLLP